MFHTPRDVATFFAEALLFVATGVGVIYAFAVLIALVFNVFRSSRALSASLALSAFASIPLLLALALQWPYLPGEWDINPTTGVLSLVAGVLLAFVWLAPMLQNCSARRKTPGPAEKSPNPTGNRSVN